MTDLAQPPPPFDDIDFSDQLGLHLHPGYRGVWWAVLHVGRAAVELGAVRAAEDLNGLLSVIAQYLLEHRAPADDIYVSTDRKLQLVLAGSWVLSARTPTSHVHLGTSTHARIVFDRLKGAADVAGRTTQVRRVGPADVG